MKLSLFKFYVFSLLILFSCGEKHTASDYLDSGTSSVVFKFKNHSLNFQYIPKSDFYSKCDSIKSTFIKTNFDADQLFNFVYSGVDKSYDFNTSEGLIELRKDIRSHFYDKLSAQKPLLENISKLGDYILSKYPKDKYYYLGLGRSPAGLMAYLDLECSYNVFNVPLSSFRPRISDVSSVAYQFLKEYYNGYLLMTEEQKIMLFKHFKEFMPDLSKGKSVLLLDYASTGFSVVTAHYFLNEYLRDEKLGSQSICFYITQGFDLAFLNDKLLDLKKYFREQEWDEPKYLEWRKQVDFFYLSRAYKSLGLAFQSEFFDDYSEYGSYKLLRQDFATFEADRPKRVKKVSFVQSNYEILKEVLSDYKKAK